jgi:hypothetical protein
VAAVGLTGHWWVAVNDDVFLCPMTTGSMGKEFTSILHRFLECARGLFVLRRSMLLLAMSDKSKPNMTAASLAS